ncbi:hypothetical protein [Nocardiopsis sp. CNR-923]|nr:hypothetical protein [Nocardiopsis sp. CNR-923]
MGHRKEVNCFNCNGRKTIQESRDGVVVTVPCPMCDGTGKQPS